MIEIDVANDFIDLHHRQGSVKNMTAVRSFGLLLNDDIVAVAQFCAPRTSAKARDYSYEWVRLAFKSGIRIRGGASRLFKFAVSTVNMNDVFTYQDTTGEVTNVYEQCGMTLISQASTKQYVVAPGMTIETGSVRDVLGIPYVVRFGPDRILKTSLGEVTDPITGIRKSNLRIFIEDLGWHTEETSGDRVYEWVNADRTYYTYRITADDSPKWYVGVSHLPWADGTTKQCLDDGYWGSGGVKYQNWNVKHYGHLKKEVLGLFSKSSEAHHDEDILVGDSWKTDECCLNSKSGGFRSGGDWNLSLAIKTCTKHGDTWHQGDSCKKCTTSNATVLDTCYLHGLTWFQHGNCNTCISDKFWLYETCPIHGEVRHQLGKCQSCAVATSWTIEYCEVHGASNFHGGNCHRCEITTRWSDRVCPIHGETRHQGNACMRCVSDKTIAMKICDIHGEVKFFGNTCATCTAQSAFSLKECMIHGEAKHQGSKCLRCTSGSTFSVKECAIHGEAKHRGNSCVKCSTERGAHNRYHIDRGKVSDQCRFCAIVP